MFRFTGDNTIFILIFASIFHKRPNEIPTNDRTNLSQTTEKFKNNLHNSVKISTFAAKRLRNCSRSAIDASIIALTKSQLCTQISK